MAKIWEEYRGYRLCQAYVNLATRSTFRSVRVEGLENVPSEGAVLLAPNHCATLMDPLLMLVALRRPVGFGARSDIFANPRIARILRWLRIVPLARERNGLSEVAKNFAVFDEIIDCIGHDVPFCMYAEGTHRPERGMLPVKKAIFRIARMAREQLGKPVYMDKNAYEADGVILSCRLKPHNAFRGPVESGPCKMMTVGLGKQKGAEQVHSDGMDIIARNIPTMAKVTLSTGKILFAIPCLENAYDQTMMFEAIPAERILEREPELLKIAFENMPSILVGAGDVLVVDTIGKNFSGTGVDPNITGTFSTPYASGGVQVQRTCFLRLSDESHGNSLGVGLASAITRQIFDIIDADAMYTNCMTSTVIKSAMVPCVMNNDREAIQFCIRTCNRIDRDHPKVIRIKNSLHIGQIMLSEAYYEEVLKGQYPGLTALDAPEDITFDQEGALTTPWLAQ